MGIAVKRSRRDFAVAVAVAAVGAATWLLLSLTGGGAGTAHASHGLPLDHFLCYKGQFNPNTPVGANITLKDQFAQQPVPHQVGAPQWFCNPTRKNHPGVGSFPIVHPNNHLTAYRLNGRVPAKRLRVNNQFQTAAPGSPPNLFTDPGTTQQPRRPLILTPTRKNAQPPVANIDHFKCYPTRPVTVNQQVVVQDQFPQNGNLTVLRASLVCNPAVKKHGNRTFQVRHPNQHLVCYTTTTFQFPTGQRPMPQLRNQFGQRQLAVAQRFLLCVPSRKTVVP
jgi:hypothetical protein